VDRNLVWNGEDRNMQIIRNAGIGKMRYMCHCACNCVL